MRNVVVILSRRLEAEAFMDHEASQACEGVARLGHQVTRGPRCAWEIEGDRP
jgi:hypothetical protein